MKKIMVLIFLTLSSLLAKDIKIENAYVRATPPSLPNSAAFMTIKNDSNKDISIIKAFSNVSNAVELHVHQMKKGIMQMYPVSKIDIPAHGQTDLKPGGFHIMFIGLHHPLEKGKSVTFTLKFSNGEKETVTAPIKTVIGGMQYQMKHGN